MESKTLRRLIFILAILLWAPIGWAKTYRLTSTVLTPAATGEVKTDQDRNGNVEVEVKVEHLAKPAMLKSPATMYVVWFREEGKPPVNQGQLRVDNNLKGRLKTTTTHRKFEVFLTAEKDPMVEGPSDYAVLRATIQE